MTESGTGGSLLRTLLMLSSIANIAGGLVLFGTWAINFATDPQHHVPPIVFAIGGSMIIQGSYTAAYLLGRWRPWGDLASGALLAGQLISGCIGLRVLVMGIFYNERASNGGIEPGPVLAGLMIGVNALLSLILLFSSGALKPKTPARAAP
jgi:hypothetical protein